MLTRAALTLLLKQRYFAVSARSARATFCRRAAGNGARGLLEPGDGALLRAAANLRFSQVEYQLLTIEN